MKFLLPGAALVIGLAAGFAGGMFWAQRTVAEPLAEVVSDSVSADDPTAEGTTADSIQMASADSASSASDQTRDVLADEPPAQAAEAEDVPDALSDELADEEAVEDPAIAQENYQKLAQIFSVMDAGQAAAVLVQLEDSEIEGILRVMQGRAVAPILEEMDPERVASISRQVLGPGGTR